MVVYRLSGYPLDLNSRGRRRGQTQFTVHLAIFSLETARCDTLNGIANGLAAARQRLAFTDTARL